MKVLLSLVSLVILPGAASASAFADIHESCVNFLQDHGASGGMAEVSCSEVGNRKQLACVEAQYRRLGDVDGSCIYPAEAAKLRAFEAKLFAKHPPAHRKSGAKTRSHRKADSDDGDSYGYARTRRSGDGDDGGSRSSTVIVVHPGGAPTVGIDTGGGVVIPTNGGQPFQSVGIGGGTVLQP